MPPPDAMPAGCRFAPRCRYAADPCRAAAPLHQGAAPSSRA
ncbi:MAG: hypothetical protein ACK51F_09535 [Rhodospirillales bacterium]